MYLKNKPTPELQAQIAAALKPLIEHGQRAGILFDGHGENTPDYATGYFNGDRSKGLSHETFVPVYLNSRLCQDGYFSFCKTAAKPYDVYVTAALLKMKDILGVNIIVSSDGGPMDWQDGVKLYEEVYEDEQAPPLSELELSGVE
jgi:hypothetical protein